MPPWWSAQTPRSHRSCNQAHPAYARAVLPPGFSTRVMLDWGKRYGKHTRRWPLGWGGGGGGTQVGPSKAQDGGVGRGGCKGCGEVERALGGAVQAFKPQGSSCRGGGGRVNTVHQRVGQEGLRGGVPEPPSSHVPSHKAHTTTRVRAV